MTNPGDWQEIEHTADYALRVRGNTLQGLFVNAAAGLYQIAVDLTQMRAPAERTIEVSGLDAETLLVNWLNELLYYTETEALGFAEFEMIEFGPRHLRAIARGQAGAAWRKYVKAATFNGLQIESVSDRYEATIVFDV